MSIEDEEYIATLEQRIAMLEQHIEAGRPTLRDQFAAAALGGMLADTNFDATQHRVAEKAYLMADAMVEARKQ